MIGNVMQAAVQPSFGEVSTRMADALVEKLRRPPRAFVEGAQDDFWFRASDLHNLCPRMCALMRRDHLVFEEEYDAETLYDFAVGTAYHRAFQDELLHALGDVFQGAWEPSDGQWPTDSLVVATRPTEWVERGWYARPATGGPYLFREPKGRIPEVRLVGKWDGVLAWPDAPHEVLELKTIREDLFGRVSAVGGGQPLAKHLLQVQAYMWMSGLSMARIVYVCKGGKSLRMSIAEHVVPRDEAMIATLRQDLQESLAQVVGTVGGPLPLKILGCRIKSDTRARRCPARDACFLAERQKA